MAKNLLECNMEGRRKYAKDNQKRDNQSHIK